MRIAFAYDNAYPWANGGIDKRRFLIMRELAKKGNDVHFFTMHRKGMPSYEFEYDGISYHCCGNTSDEIYTHGRRNIGAPLRYSIGILKIFRYRFDMIDADAFPILHIVPISLYSRIKHVKLVVTWHEVWNREYWKDYIGWMGGIGYWLEGFAARSAWESISNSSATKEELEKEFGIVSSTITVFPAAIDSETIESFTKKHACKAEKKFCIVGRLVPEKRIGLAIEKIKDVNARLSVVGVGPERKNLEQLARKNEVAGKVDFIENLSEEELFGEICTSKALLMLSSREGLSMVSIEALCLGVPVITLDTTPLPTEIKKLCTVVKESELSDAMSRLAEGKKDKVNGESLLKEFSAQDTEKLYEKLCKAK